MSMQSSGGSELLHSLALCLAPPLTTLRVGVLPPDWPLDIPLPQGARVLGGSVGPGSVDPQRPDERRPPPLTGYFDAPGAATELAVFFIDACRMHGWKPTVDGYPTVLRLPDGHVLDRPTGFYAEGPDNRSLQVQIQPFGDGRCGIQLRTGWRSPKEQHVEFDKMRSLAERVLYHSKRGRIIIAPGGGGSDSFSRSMKRQP